jgi:hypothetical protein
MIPDIYKDLVLRLHQKTLQNQVNWKTTAENNTYIVYLKDFSLTLWSYQDNNAEGVVLVNIINSDGDTIDQFYTSESELDYSILDETFSAARRVALKIDVAIRSMMEQLSSPISVGEDIDRKPKKAEQPDDDVPF